LRAGKASAIPIAVMAAAIAVTGLSAHRRDELLQAARIAVDTNGLDVELDLTPGIDVSEVFLAEADLNRDGALSADEQWAYCRRVAAALRLELDGLPLQLTSRACMFPAPGEISRGEGTIQLRASASAPQMSVGDHQVVFRNGFQPARSVYLANALVPSSDDLAVTAQHRDADQRSLAIDYRVSRAQIPRLPLWPLGAVAGGALAWIGLVRRDLRTAPR
jgi:hypothetical protein